MYFKKGLRDTGLFHKLARKDVRTCEELFDIENQYATAEEVVSETQESKRDKKTSHHDRSESSRSQEKKKKADREVANIERPRSPKPTHRVKPNKCAEFLECKCVIHPQRNHKMRDCFKIDSLAEVLANAKNAGPNKKPEDHDRGF